MRFLTLEISAGSSRLKSSGLRRRRPFRRSTSSRCFASSSLIGWFFGATLLIGSRDISALLIGPLTMFLSIPVDGRVARGLLRPLGFTLLGVVVRELLVAMETLVVAMVTAGDGVTWILVDDVRLASSGLRKKELLCKL